MREHGAKLPPDHLRDAHYPGAKKLGRGQGYVYPHDEPGGVADQPLLPPEVEGERFYEPTDRGFEGEVARAAPGERTIRPSALRGPGLVARAPVVALEVAAVRDPVGAEAAADDHVELRGAPLELALDHVLGVVVGGVVDVDDPVRGRACRRACVIWATTLSSTPSSLTSAQHSVTTLTASPLILLLPSLVTTRKLIGWPALLVPPNWTVSCPRVAAGAAHRRDQRRRPRAPGRRWLPLDAGDHRSSGYATPP